VVVQVRSARTGAAVDEDLDVVAAFFVDRLSTVPPPGVASPSDGVLCDLTVQVGVLDLPGGRPAAQPARQVFSVNLHRSAAVLGPLWTHNEPGPCPQCLATRWKAIRPAPEIKAIDTAAAVLVAGRLPGITPFALDMMWSIFTATVPGGQARGHVVELRFDSLQTRRFPLIADSACAVCARPRTDSAEAAAIEFVARPKRSAAMQRQISATEFDLPVAGYANPVCGMLSDTVFPAYHVGPAAPVAGAFRAPGARGPVEVSWSGHATDYRTSTYAGFLEGLERYASLQARGKPSAVYGSYAELAPDALDPLRCGVYADEFYAGAGQRFRRYAPDQKMHWVWGYSLRDRRASLVPEQLVYYLEQRADYPNFVFECSNGCASGSSLEEAILYGLLELIERDAFLLHWYGKQTPPEIDVASCRNSETRAMADRLHLLGYRAQLFDIRVDLPIPVVMAVVVRRRSGLGNLCFSASAGLDAELTAAAALREAASYVEDLTRRTEMLAPELREMARDYTKVTELAHHSLLYGLPEMAPQAAFLFENSSKQPIADVYKGWAADHPSLPDLTEDLRSCLDLVYGLGMDVIVVDQTCPEQEAVGVSTACVIVPGLVPIDFGWGRQRALRLPRLRTAFRAAGRRDTDLDPGALHLHPHPFP